MGRSKAVLLVPLLGLLPLQALACYTVYDRTDRVVYYGDSPPVDMSRPLHQTVPARFPGGHLVFDSSPCKVDSLMVAEASRADDSTSSPLLTDERTARAMKAEFRQVGRGVVLVAPKDAKMSPGVTVVPASRLPARGPVRQMPAEPEQEQPQFQPLPQRRY